MTNQEAFDTVYQWLARDGASQAVKPGSQVCVYRTPDANKCAIGCLIPDNLYDPSMEEKSIASVSQYPGILPILSGVDMELLNTMRCYHDSPIRSENHPRQGWQKYCLEQMALTAEYWGLTIPEMKGG